MLEMSLQIVKGRSFIPGGIDDAENFSWIRVLQEGNGTGESRSEAAPHFPGHNLDFKERFETTRSANEHIRSSNDAGEILISSRPFVYF